jgi:hypothetical protein
MAIGSVSEEIKTIAVDWLMAAQTEEALACGIFIRQPQELISEVLSPAPEFLHDSSQDPI